MKNKLLTITGASILLAYPIQAMAAQPLLNSTSNQSQEVAIMPISTMETLPNTNNIQSSNNDITVTRTINHSQTMSHAAVLINDKQPTTIKIISEEDVVKKVDQDSRPKINSTRTSNDKMNDNQAEPIEMTEK